MVPALSSSPVNHRAEIFSCGLCEEACLRIISHFVVSARQRLHGRTRYTHVNVVGPALSCCRCPHGRIRCGGTDGHAGFFKYSLFTRYDLVGAAFYCLSGTCHSLLLSTPLRRDTQYGSTRSSVMSWVLYHLLLQQKGSDENSPSITHICIKDCVRIDSSSLLSGSLSARWSILNTLEVFPQR